MSSEIWEVSDVARWLVFVGLALTLIALALTAATLMSYDALLMPTQFWTGGAPAKGRIGKRHHGSWTVLRPPSQAQVVLFYEMVHVWKAFFIPSLICTFAAVAMFVVALVHNSICSSMLDDQDFGLVLIALVALLALTAPLAWHYRHKKPNLGFED